MSDSADLRKQLADAVAAYKGALQNVENFEGKLKAARKAESDALCDDDGSADEKKIVKAVAEAQGLQSVYSRRAEVARQRIPEALAAIPPIVKALAQDLVNRCYALAETRAARHRELFRARLNLEAFHRKLAHPTFPVDFESNLDQLIDCCLDVINAKVCVPHLSFVFAPVMLPDLTFKQLQLDLDNLEAAESAYAAEVAREYNFEEPVEVLTEPQPVES